MKYGDFSTLVQLGVGLHLGTAVLQMFGEFGAEPLVRTIARIKAITENKSIDEELDSEVGRLESDYEIFRIRLFNEMRHLFVLNSAVAVALIVILVVISYKFDDVLNESFSVVISALCVVPAFLTLGVLWWNASGELKKLKKDADALERRVLRS